MEVDRKRLLMLDGSCLQDLAKRCTEVGRKLLHMLAAVGRMIHRGGKDRLLDVSCLQPLAEGCAKIGRSAC